MIVGWLPRFFLCLFPLTNYVGRIKFINGEDKQKRNPKGSFSTVEQALVEKKLNQDSKQSVVIHSQIHNITPDKQGKHIMDKIFLNKLFIFYS